MSSEKIHEPYHYIRPYHCTRCFYLIDGFEKWKQHESICACNITDAKRDASSKRLDRLIPGKYKPGTLNRCWKVVTDKKSKSKTFCLCKLPCGFHTPHSDEYDSDCDD